MSEETSQAPKDVIGFFDYYLVKKAPFQIPAAAREALVNYGPWVVVILLLLSVPFVLYLLGLNVALFPAAAVSPAYPYGFAYWPALLGFLGAFALRAMALPGLFARKMSGWTLMFYAEAISVIGSILAMNVLGGLVWGLISFYILFQIRGLYKN